MQKTERLQALSDALATHNVMRLRDVAALLGVSEMTVRRDIASTPERFTYLGGYIVRAANVPYAGSYVLEEELDHFAQAKAEASTIAARLIRDGETIFIDCGTTLTTLAKVIPDTIHVTVICYSLNVADILRRKHNVRMILLGGVYMPSSDSFTGDDSVAMLRKMGINRAFISAGGVDPVRGVSCWNFHEVALKQAAMASAVERHLVVDSSKLGQLKVARFAELNEFTSIITEAGQQPISSFVATQKASSH